LLTHDLAHPDAVALESDARPRIWDGHHDRHDDDRQILAKHSGKQRVEPGENVWVDVDVLMTHDVCGPGPSASFTKSSAVKPRFGIRSVVIIPDHYIFTADQKCHRNVQTLRDFVKEQGLKYYYDPEFVTNEPTMPNPYRDPTKTNYKGVCHKALPEEGHIRPGEDIARHRQPHLHRRRVRAIRHRRRQHRCGFRPGHRQAWLKVPPTMKFTFHGRSRRI
jgi:3-isopropylmalate/(R)-2-methylmalate dehydratase large subunit